ncbi:MAG: rod shape-determining protein RodA [Calditrichaeota bacterium]|nr:MAG: rod shape-determining protein RodA [Calditrichota bacterium]
MVSERFQRIDPILPLTVLGLVGCGLIALYSTSQSLLQAGGEINYFQKQLFWAFLGISGMIILAFIPTRWIFKHAWTVYAIAVVLLIAIDFIPGLGFKGYGASRWIRIGGIRFQPSEFAKLATILALSRYLSWERLNINELKPFAIASSIVLLPFALIVRQPDLGTALALAALVLPMFFWVGLSLKNLFKIIAPLLVLIASFQEYAFYSVMILIAAYLIFTEWKFFSGLLYFILNALMGLVTPMLWNQLADYQKQRLIVFLNPEKFSKDAGYQIIQSKVAIGSGGWLGKGFLQGSQTQLRFLPEQHTDFIFAVIGEEFGFIGVMVVLTLFLIMLLRMTQLAGFFRNRFQSIFTIGVVTSIAFHMLVNVGMTIGFFPVTGLPLPFLSYGGSALITNLMMVGIVLNFFRNRYE